MLTRESTYFDLHLPLHLHLHLQLQLQIKIQTTNIQRGDPWKILNFFRKYAKGGPFEFFFFDFLFNTLFNPLRPENTIKMSFWGLRMFKSPKSIQCYTFAVVNFSHASDPPLLICKMCVTYLFTTHSSAWMKLFRRPPPCRLMLK